MMEFSDDILKLDPKKRALLERLMAREAAAAASVQEAAIPRRPDAGAPIPLSAGQERLWFLDQLAPGNPAYNMPAAFRLEGPLVPAALAGALREVVRRHEVLRTTFAATGGEPRQVVAPRLDLRLPVADLAALPAERRTEETTALAGREARALFDLAAGPLVRAALLRLGPSEHVLLLTVHHTVSDGWSMGVLFRELETLYNAAVAGGETLLPELPIQYADFAVWQRQRLQGPRHSELVEHWKSRLAGAPPVLDLPADRPRPPVQTYRGRTESLSFPAGLGEELRLVGRRQGATLFMTLLAAFATLLGRWSGSEDVVVGTPVAGRDRKELEPLIGLFLSMLPLRNDLSENPSFEDLLTRVRAATLDAFSHAEIPFERLLEELGVERNLSHAPLFQNLFVLQNAPGAPLRLSGLHATPLASPSESAKLDLQLVLAEEGAAGLRGWLEYRTDLFEPATIQRMNGHLQTLLAAVAGDTSRPVWELPLLPEAERRELLAWNATARDYDLGLCLHQWIETQARRSPEVVAVFFEGETLSYGELDARSNRLAHHLQALGVGLEDRVAVCAERSIEMVVALVAILKAGAAYVPLDPEYPRDRLAYMLEDSGAGVLLTQERLRDRLDAGPVPTLSLDTGWEEVARESAEPLPNAVSPEQTAYVIYTSGSTGRPKGVAVSHRGICNRLLWMQEAYGLTAEDRVLQKTPFSFDVSVWEFFWPLMTGARLVVARPGGHRDGSYLVNVIAREEVTTLHFVPSMLQVFLEEPDLSRCRSLRRVMCSGEALPKALQDRFHERLDAGLHNLYGPTEASVDVTFWACERGGTRPNVPIGRPITNTQIHILDRHLARVPVGVPGELHIGGVGLARGYAGRADLTAERFVPDPFASAPGGRLYKTGDLCRWQPDGAIEYLGRLDHQVKIRGFRIELGEIEAELRGCAGIRETVVIARMDAPGEARLVAYVVPEGEPRPSMEDLRAVLRKALPEHMVPAAFVFLEAMPLSPNGKADRKALPAPDFGRPELAAQYVAPRTHAEEVLAAVWSRVLGVDPVGVHDNFFALGGDSIRSIRVLALARERGLELTLQQIFQNQTIAALAARAGRRGDAVPPLQRTAPLSLVSEADRRSLPPDVEDAYPVTQLQAGMLFHSELAPGTAVYHDVYSLRLRAPFAAGPLRDALQDLAARHPALRTSFDLARYGEPLQLVHTAIQVPLTVTDLSGLSEVEQEAAVAAWIEEEKGRPFDAGSAPLLRYAVHVRGEGDFQLTLGFHHAILDGWSVATLTTELLRLYASRLGPGEAALAEPLETSFRDYVALEVAALGSEADERYWRERLSGSGRTVLPRWPRLERASGRRRVIAHEVRVPEAVSAGLSRLAAQAAVPVKSVLLAAHLRVLALLSGQPEVLTGLVANGRPEESGGDRVLGLFLNVLPFRLGLPGGTWPDLVQATFAAESEALPHRRYPMVKLQRSLGGEPLFETSFNFVHFHVYEGVRSLVGLEVADVRFDEETNFPLVANFSLGAGRSVRLVLAHDPGSFGEGQIALIAACYGRVLEAMSLAPGSRYETADLLPLEEQARLAAWNATAADYDLEKPLHAWIEAQAEKTPEAEAVEAEEGSLTYRELLARARQLAHHLQGLGVGLESRVALCAERSLEMVVGLVGILEAGAAYVPLDPSYPAERLTYMLEDSRAAVLLTQERLLASLPATDAPVVCLDAGWEEISRAPQDQPLPSAGPYNLAYTIYTSGSTGRPKGAMVPHRGIVNRLLWKQEAYGLQPDDRVLQKTPFSFDVSVWEFFWPLMVGARLVMARPEGHKDPSYLAETVQRAGITTLHFVPSMLRVFLDEPEAGRCRGLRRVLCSGEALPPALVERFHTVLPGVELHNLYGPTEASVDVTAWPCEGDPAGLVPIGRPISNLQIRVLDGQGLPVPVGSPGELHIAGVGLGRGYLGRAELTAEKFVPDPWGEAGSRLYRTGDLARWLPDGSLEYLGRIDHQVKIRGFRIELGEIEAVLGQHPGVSETVVVARGEGGEARLVAYLAVREGFDPAVEELRSHLRQHLPEHMVPAVFVRLPALPLSPNGKVDRKALPRPDEFPVERERPYVAPQTPVEKDLAATWSQVLRVSQVGVDDDFFALGGDSILSIRLVAMARERGMGISVQQIFEHRTIRQLAAVVPRADLDAAGLLSRLDQLSDEQVEALLAGMLGGEEDAGPVSAHLKGEAE